MAFQDGDAVIFWLTEHALDAGTMRLVNHVITQEDASAVFQRIFSPAVGERARYLFEGQGFRIYVADDNLHRFAPCTLELLVKETLMFDHEGIMNQYLADLEAPDVLRLLKMAVAARNLPAARCLIERGQELKSPLYAFAPELLKILVENPHPEKKFEAVPEWITTMAEMDTVIGDLNGLVSLITTEIADELSFTGESYVVRDGGSIEHLAVMNGDVILLIFVCRTYNMRRRGQTLRNGHPGALALDDFGRSPLHYAAINGRVGILKAYAEWKDHPANRVQQFCWIHYPQEFDVVDIDGKTPLDYARVAGEHVVEALMKLKRHVSKCYINYVLDCGPTRLSMTRTPDYDYLDQLIAEFDNLINDCNPEHVSEFLTDAARGESLGKLKWLVSRMHVNVRTFRSASGGHSLLYEAVRVPPDAYVSSERDREIQENLHVNDELCRLLSRVPPGELVSAFGLGPQDYDMRAFACRYGCFDIDRLMYIQCCGEFYTPGHAAVVKWLLQELDYHRITFKDLFRIGMFGPARDIIRIRLQVNQAVDDCFQDIAPCAMDLIKAYNCSPEDQEVKATPESLAFLCLERDEEDPLNYRELCRLKLLQWLIHDYGLDPTTLMNADGETLLHEAVRNKQIVITTWLGRKYHCLTRVLGRESGKLPIHIALANVTREESEGHFQLCRLVAVVTQNDGATRYDPFVAFFLDRSLWSLRDSQSQTAGDYAIQCKDESLKQEALEVHQEKALHDFVQSLSSNMLSLADVISFFEDSELELLEYFREHCDHTLHEAFRHYILGFGRLDILKWYGERIYVDHLGRDRDDIPFVLRLGGHPRDFRLRTCRTICHPLATIEVNDNIEVAQQATEGSTRYRLGTVRDMDATRWKVEYIANALSDSPEELDQESVTEEWVAKDSLRVNLSGVLQLEYDIPSCDGFYVSAIDPEKLEKSLMSSKDYAIRCRQDEVVQWIKVAEQAEDLRTKLLVFEANLMHASSLDVSPGAVMEAVIVAENELVSSSPQTSTKEYVLAELRPNLYVLDSCWHLCPFLYRKVWPAHMERYDGAISSLLENLSYCGKLLSMQWILQNKDLGEDASDHLKKALIAAAVGDRLEIVKMVFQHMKDSGLALGRDNMRTLVGEAVGIKSVSVARYLLESDFVQDEHLTPDHISSVCWRLARDVENDLENQRKVVEILKLLLKRGVRPESRVFDSRCHFGRFVFENNDPASALVAEMFDLLCRHGGDLLFALESYGYYTTNVALRVSSIPVSVYDLVDKIAATEHVFRAMHTGATVDEIATMVENKNVDVKLAYDRRGTTLLFEAIACGNVACVEWLVRFKGVDIHKADVKGVTPQQLASQVGDECLIQTISELRQSHPRDLLHLMRNTRRAFATRFRQISRSHHER